MTTEGKMTDPEQVSADTAHAPGAEPLDRTVESLGSGLEPTMGVGLSDPDQAPARVVVRAGQQEDYRDLIQVDPRHFIVGPEIARGGMGRILGARDRRLGRPVAIKELLTATGELRTRFEREARITAKLQHPAIVSVLEAGTWPTGEPFYVMKLVSGDSLAKVIADRPTFEARLALLPTVIAVADALAYAHSMRVIHRDLKPANVLVGEFGETVVIDWGLAKDLSDASDDAVMLPARGPAADMTVVGSVMGTPAFMPVEQAEGDAVDERADVYALGAMLYNVLAGAPPYAGRTSEIVLDAVVAGPPPPINVRAPGVPRELATIMNKAMARAAADRYPTAKGLADDLKKFQTGQLVGAHHYTTWQLLGRWFRRHRAPIAVAASALILVGVLSVLGVRRILLEQSHTDEQRRMAERNRGDAEGLMGFMLGEMHDKLEPLGKLHLLASVAKAASSYYDRREDLTAAEEAKRALARRNMGDVLMDEDKGSSDSALKEYRASLTATAKLVAQDPTNPALQADLATSHMKVGFVLQRQGDAKGALAAHRASLAIREALMASDRANEARRRDVAESHHRIGDALLVAGDTAGSLAEFRGALAIWQELVAVAPTNARYQSALSATHDGIGSGLIRQGETALALAEYRKALTITEALAALDPENAERKNELASGYQRIGNVLIRQGDRDGALEAQRTSQAIYKGLVANDPTNSSRLRDLWSSHNAVGGLLDPSDPKQSALEEYLAAREIAKRLAARDPLNGSAQQDLAISHERVGPLLAMRGDKDGALAEYRAARAIEEKLLEREPANPGPRWQLVINHIYVGEIRVDQGDLAAALEEYEQSLGIAARLVAEDPTNADKKQLLKAAHGSVGDVLVARGDRAAAIEHYRASLAIAAELADKDPTYVTYQSELATAHMDLGNALLAHADRAGALAELRAALEVAKRVSAATPKDDDARALVTKLASKVAACCGAAKGSR
ncbi:MAG: Fis family transcriptional regulator [Myxococcales bacterium]|nr:Fis family transcriptional regulator [Myxococcales bacterium]